MTLEERFWSKVKILGPNECWIWQAGKGGNGYGHFWKDGTYHNSNRIAWELKHGPIPDGMNVLHFCDNRPCCNDKHLFLGTHQDNMDDMVKKGRQCKGQRDRTIWSKGYYPNSKLTETQVQEIRALKGIVSQRKLANIYGLRSKGTIHKIHNNLSWSYI